MWPRSKPVAYFSLLMLVILLFSEVARAAMPIPQTPAASAGRSPQDSGFGGSSDAPTIEEELGLTNPFTMAGPTSQDGSGGPVVASAPTGRLLFAPAIDVDGDAGTNPAESKAVPVIDLFGHLGGGCHPGSPIRSGRSQPGSHSYSSHLSHLDGWRF
jgi:hypothetical protein